MRIVVTGGAGFIGSHIVDAYILAGHEVFVIDNLSAGDKRNVNKQATFYPLDILDPSLPKLLSDISPDILSHHAAQMDLRRSVADPLFDARVNILGLVQILEAIKSCGIKKVIYASSGGAVYGEQQTFPAREDHPTHPESPYGVSKLSGEYYLAYYQTAFGLSHVILRYGNVYGPRQSAKGEAGVIAIFIQHLLHGESPTINGDGKQTRDYIYVDDVVAANLLVLSSPFTGRMNIGTGKETDVLTIYELLGDKIGSGIKAVHGSPKKGEQRRSSLDTSHARGILGWCPRVPLGTGLDKTVEYCRQMSVP